MTIPLHIEYYWIYLVLICSVTLLGIVVFTFVQRKAIRLPALLLTLPFLMIVLHLVTIQVICDRKTTPQTSHATKVPVQHVTQ